MAEVQDKRYFAGMNQDSENRNLQQGECRYILNCRTGSSDRDGEGAIENTKGNKLVPVALPPGQNVTIGTYEDKTTQSVIYFVWNELNRHCIFRYFIRENIIYEVLQSPILGLNPNKLITGIGVQDDLLYWTDDYNPQRKINLSKATSTPDKRRTWNIYFDPLPASNGLTEFYATVKSPQGNQMFGGPVNFVDFTDSAVEITKEELATQIETTWNNNAQLSQWFTAKKCGCHVEITSNLAGKWTLEVTSQNLSTAAIAQNFYPEPFKEQYIDLIKHPPKCEPKVDFIEDREILYNYVESLAPQFRIRYVYDDNEKSTWGPWSVIPGGSAGCFPPGSSNNPLNAIEIDYSNDHLIDQGSLSVIKRVEIGFRENNVGKLKRIITLDQCDIGIDAESQKYIFRNDGQYPVVPDKERDTNAHSVPLLSKSLTILKNRLWLGGNTEGYGNECVDTEVTVGFNAAPVDPEESKTWTIKGEIAIKNPMAPNFGRNQFLHKDTGATEFKDDMIVFGGFSTPELEWGSGYIQRTVGTKYNQYCPAGGFTVYLAGTDYFAVSSQNDASNNHEPHEAEYTEDLLPSPTTGCPNAFPSSTQQTYAISPDVADSSIQNSCGTSYIYESGNDTFVNPHGGAAIGFPNPVAPGILPPLPNPIGNICPPTWRKRARLRLVQSDNPFKQCFEITGVPPGRYIVRIASHLCDFGGTFGAKYDLNDPNREWQQTSTNLISIGGVQDTEIEINLGPSGGTHTLGDSVIADLTFPLTIDNPALNVGLTGAPFLPPFIYPFGSSVVTGYLLDNDGESNQNNLRERGFAVEKSQVVMKRYDPDANAINNTAFPLIGLGAFVDYYTQNYLNKGEAITDHNGYFFISQQEVAIGGTSLVRIAALGVTADPSNPVGSPANSNGFTYLNALNGIQSSDRIIYSNFIDNHYVGLFGQDPQWTTSGPQVHSQRKSEEIILYTNTQDASRFGRTIIEGQVLDQNGNGISGISVLYTHTSRIERTDSSGNYSIVVYGDGWRNQNDRLDKLIFVWTGLCELTFTSPNTQVANITPFNQQQADYNFDHHFLAQVVNANIVLPPPGLNLKRGGRYHLAIAYYDVGNRSTPALTVESNEFYIPFYTEDLSKVLPQQYPNADSFEYGSPRIEWEIKHDPPVWATHYQILRTKNLNYNSYIQWAADEVLYVVKYDTDNSSPISTSFANSTWKEIYVSLANVETYIEQNTGATVGYTYQKGDRIRIYKDEGDNFLDEFFDYPVKGQRGNYVIIEGNDDLPELKAGFVFEIYTPKLEGESKLFYETGQCYSIDNPYTSTRAHSVLSGIIENGDTWEITRDIPVTNAGQQVSFVRRDFESAKISDFFTTEDENIGRANAIDKDARQIVREELIRFSNVYIGDTKINGFSDFEALNQESLPRENGLIYKLQKSGNVLLAIQKNNTVSIYVNESVITDSTGNQIVAKTDKVISSYRTLLGGYGTQNPESVVEYLHKVYFFDVNKGKVIRYAADGLEPISEKGMDTFWRDLSKTLQKYKDEDARVFGGFHPDFDEYVLTILTTNFIVIEEDNETVVIDQPGDGGGSGSNAAARLAPVTAEGVRYKRDPSTGINDNKYEDIPYDRLEIRTRTDSFGKTTLTVAIDQDGTEHVYEGVRARARVDDVQPPTNAVPIGLPKVDKQTIAWNEKYKFWSTFYSYLPEYYSTIGVRMVSFKGGALWMHNENQLHNNFYGEQFNSVIKAVFAAQPSDVKIFQWIAEESDEIWEIKEITTPEGQLSELLEDDFKTKEDVHYAEILRDKLTPNEQYPLITGDTMRSHALILELSNDSVIYTRMFAVNVYSVRSEKTNR